jgi:hypothetical protein
MRAPRPLAAALLLLVVSCSAPAPRDEPLGHTKPITFSILEDYDKGQSLTEVAADFRLFEALGVTTWRGSFGWDDYEPSPGVYDFAWLHEFVALAARHDIGLRPYVAYTPAWAASGGSDDQVWNDPPERLADWSRFVGRLASALAPYPNVLSFEVYNEQNATQWWDGTPAEYAAVLEAASSAIRGAGGDDQVLFGGMTYADLDWMQALCDEHGVGGAFDILPIHAYPETWNPETVESYLQPEWFGGEFLASVDGWCGEKPVWLNEIGFATLPGERDERDQANWWARAIATYVAVPRVEHIGIYEIREPPLALGVIGGAENYHLGIVRRDGSRKLAFHTIRRLVALLDTGTLTVADATLGVETVAGEPGELYHHLFIRPDGSQVLAVWDKTASPTLRLTLPRSGWQAVEYALDGSGRVHPRFDGRALLVRLAPGEVRLFHVLP